MQFISLSISILLAFVSIKVETTATEIYLNDAYNARMLKKVNQIRSTGCFCGKQYMPAAEPLVWNTTLYKSALGHAKEMTRYNFFAHFSIDGRDIGDRLESYGYNWQVAGENLGEGQRDFDEVLRDWLESKSHCRMVMNPKVQEMAVAKHGRYWVQHFGKQMPPNTVRKGRLED